MKESSQLIAGLKVCMKARNMTYKDLGKRLKLSEASIKRLFANETFTLERLERICEVLDISISQLVKMSFASSDEEVEYLNDSQEELLANDPSLLTVFYLLAHEWKPSEIAADYEISLAQISRHVISLEKLRLLERHPGNKIKMLVGPNITWKPNGAVQVQFERQARAEFFSHEFSGEQETLKFIHGEVSDATLRHLQRKIDELVKFFHSYSQVDATLPKSQTHSVGMSLAIRPWVYSQFSHLKKRRKS